MSHVTIRGCRICGNSELHSVLHLGEQALTGVFPRSPAHPVEAGPVELVKCTENEGGCGLVQLRQSYAPEAMYGHNYGYRSGLNQSMVQHLRGRVKAALAIAQPQPGDLIIDIGSNDSTTLQSYPKAFEMVGIDPTGIKYARYYPDHIKLIPDFFTADAFHDLYPGRRAKIITSFAMFYDLESPQTFMADIAECLTDDGIWVFEQSYLPGMLAALAYDTICHEHLNYYALRTAAAFASRLPSLRRRTRKIRGRSRMCWPTRSGLAWARRGRSSSSATRSSAIAASCAPLSSRYTVKGGRFMATAPRRRGT